MVSVIVPIYKTEKYLRECVDSILRSTHADIEIILVDDGSPDNCPEICDQYCNDYSNVKVVHKVNGGLVSAWKAGVECATGEFITFVDSDDWIDEDLIQRAVTCAVANDVEIVCYSWLRNNEENTCIKFSQTGLIETNSIIDKLVYYKGVYKIIPNSRCCKLYKTEVVREAMQYCNEYVSLGEDQQLTVACVLSVKKIFILDDLRGYHYRINNESMVNTFNADLYVKVNNTLDSIKLSGEKLSQIDLSEQIKKESVIYGISVISNSFYGKNVKDDIALVFNDERMYEGSKIIDIKDLNMYEKLMVIAIRKRSMFIVKFARFLFNIKQLIKRS